MQPTSMLPFGETIWHLSLAHPNPGHWNDAAAARLSEELNRLAAELARVDQLVFVGGIVERVLGV